LNNNRSTLLNLGNNLAQVVSFEKSAKKIKFLKEMLSREITDAAYVKEYCKINEIRNIYGCDAVATQIENATNCSALNRLGPTIACQLNDSLKDLANNTARNIFFANIVTIAMEFFQVYLLIDEISKATNVIRDESKFREIERLLSVIESDLAKLLADSQKDISGLSESKKDKFHSALNLKNAKILNKIGEIREKLNTIEIELNNARSKLEISGQTAWVNTAKASINFVANAVNMATYFKYLNPSNMFMGAFGLVGWVAIGALNVNAYMITQERLIEIRSEFDKIYAFRRDLQDLERRLREINPQSESEYNILILFYF